jgi:asparagine synthase (glutamine-hydrolysing)
MLAISPHRGGDMSHQICDAAILAVSNHPNRTDSLLSTAGEFSAAFSGRLDNAQELVRTLTESGFPPLSPNAADIMVSAVRAFGTDAPNRMRGEFAGVVTDGRQLWCVRDHLGLRPLFYRDDPQAFFAATEIKQVIAGAALLREPNLEVLQQIFGGSMPEDMPSAFKGVNRLPKATTLVVGPNGTGKPELYWHPDRLIETARISPSDVEIRFTELFERAVARCLSGNDIVSLSGGIDSPAVAAFAAPLTRQSTCRPLTALSIVFPNFPKVDERSYIESVTDYLGMDLHTYTLKARALDDLDHWCERFDGPIPTINAPQMNEYYLEARRLGFRNVLTGDIAECVIDLPAHVTGHLLMHGRWEALARLLSTQRRQGTRLKNLAGQLLAPFVPGRIANWYLSLRGLDVPKRFPDWLDRRKIYEVPYRTDLLVPGRARWSSVQTMPLEGCPITMEAAEICTALAGVTVGRPFADIDLWEFFLSLPAEIKYPDLKSKTFIRRLLRGKVPDAILDRRHKTYFDDHVMSQIDYPLLRRYLVEPTYQMPGVDYRLLTSRLEREELTLTDWFWVNDLVRIHAFLNRW